MNILKKYWNQLNQRDQKIGLLGGFFLLLVMVYLLVITPLTQKVNHLKMSIVDSRQVLRWINEASEEVKQSQLVMNESGAKNVSLLSTIEMTTQTSHLSESVTEIKQINDKEVQLIFKTVAFDQLVVWLKEIQNKNRVFVNKISLRRTDTIGIVQAELVLIRA